MPGRQMGVFVERAHADAPDRAVRIATEERAPALRAEALLEAVVGRVPALHEVLTPHEAQRPGRDPRLNGGRRARAPPAPRAMAVGHRPERLEDFEADAAAETSTGDRDGRHTPSIISPCGPRPKPTTPCAPPSSSPPPATW